MQKPSALVEHITAWSLVECSCLRMPLISATGASEGWEFELIPAHTAGNTTGSQRQATCSGRCATFRNKSASSRHLGL